MQKFSVYVLGPYHDEAIKKLQSSPNIDTTLFSDPAKDAWPERASGLLLRSRLTTLGAAEFATAPHLKVVVKQGVGVENIDLEAAKKYGVRVYNTPGGNKETVAELSITLALCLARRVCEMDRHLRRGDKLVRSNLLAKSLYRKTIGIIGMGNIGKEVAKKWSALEANLVAYDPYYSEAGWTDLPYMRATKLTDLLTISDVVTIQVPLTPETTGLIGSEEIARMKDDAILLNMSRGGIVDENAVLEALRSKKLWGVGLDATITEPPTLEVYEKYLDFENIIITPHVGGDTIECQISCGLAAVDTMVSALSGDEPEGRLA